MAKSTVPITEADKAKGKRVRHLRESLLDGMRQEDFGKMLARGGRPVSQNYVSAIENGREKMGDDVQSRIEARFNVRKQWLDEGIGEPFSGDPYEHMTEDKLRIKSAMSNLPPIKIKGLNTGNLLWVPFRERGLFLRTNGEAPSLKRTGFDLLNEELWAFEIADTRMLPAYSPGSWIICSKVVDICDLAVGIPYAIQTSDQFFFVVLLQAEDTTLQFGYTNNGDIPITLQSSDIRHAYHIEYKVSKP